MPTLKTLHESTFAGKPLKTFKIYDDPFGENEVCIELAFVDGQVEYVGIGPGRPGIVSRRLCYEGSLVQEESNLEATQLLKTETAERHQQALRSATQ